MAAVDVVDGLDAEWADAEVPHLVDTVLQILPQGLQATTHMFEHYDRMMKSVGVMKAFQLAKCKAVKDTFRTIYKDLHEMCLYYQVWHDEFIQQQSVIEISSLKQLLSNNQQQLKSIASKLQSIVGRLEAWIIEANSLLEELEQLKTAFQSTSARWETARNVFGVLGGALIAVVGVLAILNGVQSQKHEAKRSLTLEKLKDVNDSCNGAKDDKEKQVAQKKVNEFKEHIAEVNRLHRMSTKTWQDSVKVFAAAVPVMAVSGVSWGVQSSYENGCTEVGAQQLDIKEMNKLAKLTNLTLSKIVTYLKEARTNSDRINNSFAVLMPLVEKALLL